MMVSMPEPPKVMRLDEIDALPGPGTLTWHPVRHTLGIQAFGCNAYTAHTVGADVVEPHTEDPRCSHQPWIELTAKLRGLVIDPDRHSALIVGHVLDPVGNRRAQLLGLEFGVQTGSGCLFGPTGARRA
jgi:hypothetical protein